MKKDQIFIGDIMKCTKYQKHTYLHTYGDIDVSFGGADVRKELHKKDAILVKIKTGGYVDLEQLNSILDYIKIYKSFSRDSWELGGLMMTVYAHRKGCLFVDHSSLRPYYDEKQHNDNISVKKLKKQINSFN